MESNDIKKIIVISSYTASLFWFRLNMMKEFARLGYEVVALGQAPEAEWKAKFEEHGIRYRQIFVERNGTNPFNDLKTLNDIDKVLKEEKPQKIFCYQAKTIIYTCLAAKRNKIKEVYPLIAGLGSMFRATSLKSKVVGFILSTEYRIALKHAKEVIFQNKDDLSVFLDAKIVAKEKCHIINGSGVDTEMFPVMPLPEDVTFLMISRLIKDKGVVEYLKACEMIHDKYPKTRCILVGPFDTNPSAIKPKELQPYIDNEIIEYVGEQEDVKLYTAQASVFVLPSYHEGIPKTILENMACGRAIITTDAPGCRETVIDGLNGYLVPVHDAAAVAEKMESFILSPECIYQMGLEGRKLVEEKYDVNIINAGINKIMNLENKGM